MKSLESKMGEIKSCVNSIGGPDCNATIRFTMDDVEDIIYQRNKNISCGYCGYGDTRLFVIFLKEKSDEESDEKSDEESSNYSNSHRYISIVNWCGCLTYDPGYTIRDFPDFDAAYDFLRERK